MPARRDERFRRSDRLTSSKDFRRLSREGRRVASRTFILLAGPPHTPQSEGLPRLGITVSRRVGKAVVRNQLKRRVREWFRRHRSQIPPGMDVVVIARPAAAELETREVWSELDRLTQRLAAVEAR